MLAHQTNKAPNLATRSGIACRIDALHDNQAGRRQTQSAQKGGKRRLTGPVSAHKRHELARPKRQRHAIERRRCISRKPNAHVVNLDHLSTSHHLAKLIAHAVSV